MRRVLLAVLAGTAMDAAFRPHHWWWAIVAWALVSAALNTPHRRVRVAVSAAFAVAWFAPLVSWIGVLGIDARILLTLVCAAPWLALALVPDVGTFRGAWTLTAVAVLVEWLRSSAPWGGFPWGLVAYSQVDGPLVEWSRWGSDALVTAWVVLLGNALWRAMSGRGHVIGPSVLSATVLLMPSGPTAGTLSVAAVQGNVPRLGFDDVTQAQEVLDNHVRETAKLAAASVRPDLVVWPENAADSDPTRDPVNGGRITGLARALQRPILVGALVDNPGSGPSNSGLLWMPDGTIAGRYDKHHLVPFGEYLPMRRWLAPRIQRFDQIAQDIEPGRRAATIAMPRARLGTVICFEVAYDGQMSAAVREGAQLFVVQSNNATYAYTEQPAQQLQITRFRAIEHQRAAVVATTTGDSALIALDGRVTATAPRMTAATLTGELPLATGREPVDRSWPLVRLGGLLWCLWVVTRNRHRGTREKARRWHTGSW